MQLWLHDHITYQGAGRFIDVVYLYEVIYLDAHVKVKPGEFE